MPTLTAILLLSFTADPPTVTVDRDNVAITQSCRVQIAKSPIPDADNNGVIHITASDIAVDFGEQTLRGAAADQLPDSFAGNGIIITGKNVKLSGAKVAGYRVGIHALIADGLTIHHCDVSDNFHQRLKSTPQAEDGSDWLYPHTNDSNEWITTYGTGLCVEDSRNVTLHHIRARATQNGIILDAVNDSKIYDCDCSFLSGWGLALWRSSNNLVSRNAFDFCVRGYSHGVYNRGQDSAGILMFEQCSFNRFVENSATHGGDGFFGFAGSDALGDVDPREDPDWYKRRGDNSNVFMGNDFSYAAAHGLELTFSFGNRIWNNRFVDNAICGIWGGYSQRTEIFHNTFERNGAMAYGLERGGVNIEHGMRNWVRDNRFAGNACGVHLWWDDDQALLAKPWAMANGVASAMNIIENNAFDGDATAVQLRACGATYVVGNQMTGVKKDVDADDSSRAGLKDRLDFALNVPAAPEAPALGETHPVGARENLGGRQSIVMTEWGPWDHEAPLLRRAPTPAESHAHWWQLLGAPIAGDVELEGPGLVASVAADNRIIIGPQAAGPVSGVFPYTLTVAAANKPCVVHDTLVIADWHVRFFPWTIDPRENDAGWHKQSQEQSTTEAHLSDLDLRFDNNGPSEIADIADAVKNAKMPKDHFGTIASTTLAIPRGRWRITTMSDDGIRVWLDDKLVIDDWTWHPPKKDVYDFEMMEAKDVKVRVEHFEIDGFAALQVGIAQAE